MDLTPSSLAQKIYGYHQLVLMFFPPEVQPQLGPIVGIEKQQAEELAKAIVEVAKFYELGDVFNSKYVAIANLVGVAGMIYVPKAMTLLQISIAMRKQRAAMAATPMTAAEMSTPQNERGNVRDIRSGGLTIG